MIFCQRYVHSLIAVTQKLLAINLKAPCVVASGPMKAFRHFFRKFHLSPFLRHLSITSGRYKPVEPQAPSEVWMIWPQCLFPWAPKFLPSAAKSKILRQFSKLPKGSPFFKNGPCIRLLPVWGEEYERSLEYMSNFLVLVVRFLGFGWRVRTLARMFCGLMQTFCSHFFCHGIHQK